jgi:hypothetical protein
MHDSGRAIVIQGLDKKLGVPPFKSTVSKENSCSAWAETDVHIIPDDKLSDTNIRCNDICCILREYTAYSLKSTQIKI